MQIPSEGEYIEADALLEDAMHQLVLGQHQSLLVTEGGKIVGILRLTDVFATIFHIIKVSCTLPEAAGGGARE
jgi:predicted transcriptional regulator